jgi:general secretion pathway protein G
MAYHTVTGSNRLTAMGKLYRMGFTLIELLVVMAIISMLLTIAVPRYFSRVELSKETVLHENLAITRQALDKYYGDNGKYPATLEDLVSKKYLRSLPADPITGSASTWTIVPPENPDSGGVYDIRSGAQGNGHDGRPFKDW